jgi:dihydrolipoamide dehydrogenase
MTMNFDIAIIGGGPAGYNAAEKAASLGLKTVLFEKNLIGGVCLNEGCIPTKTLLYSAKILDNIKASSKYGVLNNGNPSFDLEKMIIRKDKTVRKLTAGVKMKLTSNGVTIIQGVAKLTREEEGSIFINCDENEYSATYILLCSGSETVIPPIKGLSDVDYWTSKEALETKVLPANLTIIGGGVIGMEFASFFNSLGVKITVIEMMPEILGNMDKETSRMLRAEYAKKGIEFHLDTKVIEVNEHQVTVVKNDNTTTIETDKILVSVGRKAKTDQLGLENFNIELLKNGVKVNEYMQTSHPHIYACGDITGYSMLAHTAIREGEVAINHILGKDDRMSYKAIPAVVYTNPELAGVGKTEEDLVGKEENYHVVKLPMAYAGRWVAENEQGNGLCKLITDKDEHVIGCHIMGNPASELIVIVGIAIEKNFTLDEFRKFVFPHPTVGEIIHESLYL